jgi:hypothetical protein
MILSHLAVLVIFAVVAVPALIALRHISAGRWAPVPVRPPVTEDDVFLVRRIPPDIAGAYPLSLEDKDTSRHLLRTAASPVTHRYAMAMHLRAAAQAPRQ